MGARALDASAKSPAELERELETRTHELAEAREHLAEALEQQAATAEVLRVISNSPGELGPVLNAMLENAVRICEAKFATLFRYDGQFFHRLASIGTPAELVEFQEQRGPFRPESEPGNLTERVWRTKQVAHTADYAAEPNPGPPAKLGGARSAVAVPMLKENTLVGAIVIYRQEVRPFGDKQLALVQNFAAQAVIAIENTRLLNELRQRTDDLSELLEQQIATSDILRVIAGSPTDLQPIFDAIVRNASRLCGSEYAIVARYDGELLHLAAQHNARPGTADTTAKLFPQAPRRSSIAARALVDAAVVHVPDIEMEEELEPSARERYRRIMRAVVAVPMIYEGRPLGVVGVSRGTAGPFSDRQIDLLRTFADQASIAIENVRLFTELQASNRDLSEALQQQTATADVLKVISRSTFDLQAVLDTLVELAARLCEADRTTINRQHGSAFQQVANYSQTPEHAAFTTYPIPAGRGSLVGRTIEEGRVVHIHDVLADPEFTFRESVQISGVRTMLGVPMLREGMPIGVINLQRTTVRPFTERQIELATTFADQAVIAIENVRLFDEVQARTRELSETLEQQTATSEVLQVISSSPGELEPVFQTMLENATRICEAKFGVLFLFQDGAFRPAELLNVPAALADFLWQRGAFVPSEGPLSRLMQTRCVYYTIDDAADPWPTPAARLGGGRTHLAVPMLKEDQLIGAFVIYRIEVRPFTEKQIELVSNFAKQAVIAIENTRLLNELRELLEQQTATADVLRVISTSPGQLEPVFQAMLANAVRLCDAKFGTLNLYDGEAFRAGALHNVPPAYADIRRAR